MKKLTSNLSSSVKMRLHDLKISLNLKSESEVVGYLIAFYTLKYSSLTMIDHNKCIENMKDSENQVSLGG